MHVAVLPQGLLSMIVVGIQLPFPVHSPADWGMIDPELLNALYAR